MNIINNNERYIIGSAQIGQDYGIAGSTNLNSRTNAIEFIKKAIKNNFTSFDTASSYGKSEKYIGEAIKDTKKEIKIYTKIPKLNKNNISTAEKYFEKSLQYLNASFVEGLLLHNALDWKIEGMKNFSANLKSKKLIHKFGLSIYDENDIPDDKYIDLIQVPGNIFNQKLIRSPQLINFYNSGGTIIIRSVFIQGLLFLKEHNFPKNLLKLKEPILKLRKLALDNDITIEALAIKTIEHICPFAKLIIGCDNIKQLNILSETSNIKINNDVICKAINIGNEYNSVLWDPRNWKQ